ncbi:hypothetical protein IJI91_01490 [Candidatus Saccharibacteria bacterium]|nr:hypothetical protein [Candidatus Saccharibacteria bacterium]MBR0460647.1 hypothetical protein [Candidatus Saccharibacteria bacterium]
MSPTVAAFVGAGALVFFLMVIIFYVLVVIAGWKIFEKAGEPGWKALIPIYNLYIMFKIVGMAMWFWIMLAVSVGVEIVSVILTGTSTDAADPNNLNPFVVILVCAEAILFLIVEIMYAVRTARAFGKGGGFAVGIFFLPNIFWLILGFGSAKYNKKVALKK